MIYYLIIILNFDGKYLKYQDCNYYINKLYGGCILQSGSIGIKGIL